MLEQSFGLLYFLKQSKTQEKAARFVYLRITVNGVPKEWSTKRKWTADRWNQELGRAESSREDAKSLNSYLDSLTNTVYLAKKALLDNHLPITAEAIKNRMLGKQVVQRMILEIFKQHNKEMEALVGKDFAEGTLERYETVYDHTSKFLSWNYAVQDMNILDLDYEFISRFSFWLKTERNCNHNTTVKYLANFKKIVLLCKKKKWLSYDPFAEFSLAKKKVVRIPLNSVELKRIINKEIKVERLRLVRDIFVFACYTGLAYSDCKNLKRNQIHETEEGQQYILINRQKTGSPCIIPLLPKALEIIGQYVGHHKTHKDGYVFPIISNQKINAYLKELADLCEIFIPLSFHIARHTFATTILKRNGVDSKTIQEILGHGSLAQTDHYAKTSIETILREILLLEKKLIA